MPKTNLADILTPKAMREFNETGTIKLTIIDYSTPEQKRKLAELRQQSEMVRKNAGTDWSLPGLNTPMTI